MFDDLEKADKQRLLYSIYRISAASFYQPFYEDEVGAVGFNQD